MHELNNDTEETLDRWCAASGAKFNIEKTEVPPSTDALSYYRELNEQYHAPLPDHIRIARDGDAIRVLGARIGNKTDSQTPWEPILDKIKAHPIPNPGSRHAAPDRNCHQKVDK